MCLCHRSTCWTNTCFWHPNQWFTLWTSLKKTTSGKRINGECSSFLLALVTVGSHCVQLLKCPRACVRVRVRICWGMRTGCGAPLAGVATSLWENLPGAGTNSTLTQHANPHYPPASSFHEVYARLWSSFSNEMCHLHVIWNRVKANKHWYIQNQV